MLCARPEQPAVDARGAKQRLAGLSRAPSTSARRSGRSRGGPWIVGGPVRVRERGPPKKRAAPVARAEPPGGLRARPRAYSSSGGLRRASRQRAATTGGSLALAGAERYVLNPGSVGQARERTARARFMVLDLEQRPAIFYAVHYDIAGCRRALRERKLPTRSAHLKPSPMRDRARALRRALNALSLSEGGAEVR
jgi:hypothetical protein